MIHEQSLQRDWFSKPGDSVLSLMERRNLSAVDVSASLDGGIETLRGLVSGSVRIDGKLADKLASVLGGTPGFWLRRQSGYEEALERVVSAVVSGHFVEWLERVPIPGSTGRARMTEGEKRSAVRQRLAFFNVNGPDAWARRYASTSETRFRTSNSFSSSEGATTTWLRLGELEASLIQTGCWDPDALRTLVPEIRTLTSISQPARFLPRLRAMLGSVGVALSVVRAPDGCRASGAARMLSPTKAMVLMSFRHRSDDHFWFTLFHELGHLLLHAGATFVDGEGTTADEHEREANEFARDCIIPASRRAEFEVLRPDRTAVLRFSVSVGIAAGIIVGQMQHSGMIPYDRLNTLKRRWNWDDIREALP
ncbi:MULTISPECIES: ImmA/IrrE family metallo-endopeptidase [Methylobacteriaceae]|jgi:HTH-type transcriptional regulator/antitoxin HigA|uniref:ImmA/IrrE family metallo-endopeptidase n=2 Tax=Methylobacteriaceae TaxID=119045 RepID=A0ABU9ZLX3_9HYPH|nr:MULTISPECIES: ImmA/IrrE family metallo-endopeptidase [Methylobacteriaceae]MBY0141451.1 ImmA/IrrE family metallo-endopeptidase [Methylorubrum populi]MCX7332291.1 ImmA/IrrE family metallo-endopeptidase [Hyphomicrobiales bacterium]MBI1689937.1 ImmA/IrrE family metallo-endopeptidase [Methylorubrum sp. DB1722]MBK3402625.1 ImmA/IrrE family metallo-endopeptidase [Methylorubrum rhodesianum]PIU05390.1 MAG: ImmA/IrrE family metallo-endopeptidase [Methylobacterium sp. CG09_land_8_20_14_0_10_71_15]